MTTATNTKFYYLFIQWGYIYDHKGGDKSLAAKVLYCLNATPHGHFGDSCWVQPNIALGGSCFSENFYPQMLLWTVYDLLIWLCMEINLVNTNCLTSFISSGQLWYPCICTFEVIKCFSFSNFQIIMLSWWKFYTEGSVAVIGQCSCKLCVHWSKCSVCVLYPAVLNIYLLYQLSATSCNWPEKL